LNASWRMASAIKIRAGYNHAEHLLERRQMMQAWSDYLDALKESPPFRFIGSCPLSVQLPDRVSISCEVHAVRVWDG